VTTRRLGAIRFRLSSVLGDEMTMTRATRTVLLALLVLSLSPLVLAGCGGGDDEEGAGETTTEETTSEETTTEETTTEETTTEETTTEATTEDGGGDAAAGDTVFADSGCGNCHTLAAAGSSGTTGPNLDDLQPDFDTVVEQVTNGGGGMPAFGGMLTEQEINDVAAYVSESAGG
jgi:mono/diheme cytochrome c family protein